MFAEVSDVVKIIGTASGENFAYYRVQVGKGLNPQEWIQLGGDVITPVENGVLAEWDTKGSKRFVCRAIIGGEDRSNCGYGGDSGDGKVAISG